MAEVKMAHQFYANLSHRTQLFNN